MYKYKAEKNIGAFLTFPLKKQKKINKKEADQRKLIDPLRDP